jgi:hypothetical protein
MHADSPLRMYAFAGSRLLKGYATEVSGLQIYEDKLGLPLETTLFGTTLKGKHILCIESTSNLEPAKAFTVDHRNGRVYYVCSGGNSICRTQQWYYHVSRPYTSIVGSMSISIEKDPGRFSYKLIDL